MPLPGATTLGAVYDRITLLVAANGFSLCRDHFDFDLVPSQQAGDALYRVNTTRQAESASTFGRMQTELHLVEIWLARKVRKDSNGATRQLKADMELLESALYDLYEAEGQFSVADDSVEGDCRLPSPDSDYAVARLAATVDFDRST